MKRTNTLGGLAQEFEFDLEFVFPPDLFRDRTIRHALAEAGITRDDRANRMPVFLSKAGRIAFAEANDRVKEAMWNAGWAVAAGADIDAADDEKARCGRLRDKILEKIAACENGWISPEVMRLGLLQLHQFEAERLKGRSLDPSALGKTEAPRTHPVLGMWEAQALIQAADMERVQLSAR
jgi:hypothetical protein